MRGVLRVGGRVPHGLLDGRPCWLPLPAQERSFFLHQELRGSACCRTNLSLLPHMAASALAG